MTDLEMFRAVLDRTGAHYEAEPTWFPAKNRFDTDVIVKDNGNQIIFCFDDNGKAYTTAK